MTLQVSPPPAALAGLNISARPEAEPRPRAGSAGEGAPRPDGWQPPEALTDGQAAALDDTRDLDRYTRWDHQGSTRVGRSRVLLDGLYCAACAGTIEAAVRAEPGVLGAEVNGATRRGEITWDPARTRPSAWIAAIQRAGYAAFPDMGASAVEVHRGQSRQAMWRLFVAAFCMMQVMMYATPSYVAEPGDLSADLDQLLRWASWVLSIPVLLFSAGPFFSGAWRSLRQGRIGMDVPVALGILVTFVASTGATFDRGGVFGSEVYFDSMTMFVTFLLGGRYLEVWARGRTAQSLDAVMRRLPDSVERVRPSGEVERVSVHALARGDRVRIAVGQAFAADGVVLEGRTLADEALLTGESRPVARAEGDAVVAGSLNVGAPVLMEVSRLGADTHYQQIVDLMQRAVTERPALVRAADRMAGLFLWGVLVLAALSALAWQWIDPARAVWVAVSVLIVTCPCALSLAAPSALLTAAGTLARRGVLVQRLDALESLSRVDRAVFDKTGTLTSDRLSVAGREVLAGSMGEADLGAMALALARRSTHPLSRAIVQAGGAGPEPVIADVQEHPGRGVSARDSTGLEWRLGSPAWAAPEWGDRMAGPAQISVVLASDRGGAILRFIFDESVRPDAAATLRALSDDGVGCSLLSGDAAGRVERLAAELGLTEARGQARPEDKLKAIASAQSQGHRVLAVGDGLNDAPLLARADVSVALGHGAALAQSRADFVLTGGGLLPIAVARRLARKTMTVVRQNMAWAVVYNLVCVPLAMVGWLPPWLAGLGMATSSLLVILNSMRLNRWPAAAAPTS